MGGRGGVDAKLARVGCSSLTRTLFPALPPPVRTCGVVGGADFSVTPTTMPASEQYWY